MGEIWNHQLWHRESAVFCRIRDWTVPFLCDRGPKFVTFLESRLRIFGTKKLDLSDEKIYLATSLYCCCETLDYFQDIAQHFF